MKKNQRKDAKTERRRGFAPLRLSVFALKHGLALLALACFYVAPVLTQQTQPQSVYYQIDGLVIRSDRTQPVLLQTRVTGSPTRVVFEYNPNNGASGQDLEMRDDGSGGDRWNATSRQPGSTARSE